MSTPLDFSKPLWQIHVIDKYGEGSAIVARMHHSIADGLALVYVLLSLTDMTPDAPWPEPQEVEEEVMMAGFSAARWAPSFAAAVPL